MKSLGNISGFIKRMGLSRWQITFITAFLFIGIFHNFLANEDLIVCYEKSKIGILVPLSVCNSGLPAPIPYSANYIDKFNRNVGPFDKQEIASIHHRHWLGTGPLGRDILAGLIHGSWVALYIGFYTVLFSLLIGIFFAFISGYIGDHGLYISKGNILLSIPLLFITVFYTLYTEGLIRWSFLLLLCVSLFLIVKSGRLFIPRKESYAIPFDLIVQRLLEIMQTIPDIFFLLIMLGVFSSDNWFNIIFAISFLRWPSVTRYLRAEILKVKEENFILSARSIGQSEWKIFTNYVLPLSLSPVLVSCAFAFAYAILVESALSFLGIGVPADQVTWGSLINLAKHNFSSWWIAFFPGILIYVTVLFFNSLGDKIDDSIRGL